MMPPSERMNLVVIWMLAYDCIIMTDSERVCRLPTLLIAFHSGVQVQWPEIHNECNHMHIDT